MLKTFVPMPNGPDERAWPEVVVRSREAAARLAAERGREIVGLAHTSSAWVERDLGGRVVPGWELTWASREAVHVPA
jgi:hypothetical protein